MSGLTESQLAELHAHAYDWAIGHGLSLIRRTERSEFLTHAPFTLVPSAFPRTLYNQAFELVEDYNILVHELARNHDFIINTLQDVPDDFTQNLLNIYKTVHKEGIKQDILLGIFRSDYMIHNDSENKPHLQQVELNTISSSFSSLSQFTSELHKYLIERMGLQKEFPLENLVPNDSQTQVARGLAEAHKLYNDSSAHVMMIVQKGERNRWDQRWIEYHLWNTYKISLVRHTLEECEHHAKIDEKTGDLTVFGKKISVVYYRAAYTPNDFNSEKDWAARLLLERSRAIKCPNIAYHLVGAKKVQQVIAEPGVLEKLMSDQARVKRMRASFTGLYSLAAGSDEIIKKAIANPHDYVMKPQREGGGNNFYNEDMKNHLLTMTPHDRAAYILMDRISPAEFETYILRDNEIYKIGAVSELGIFGLFIAQGEKIHLNAPAGILLRTKAAKVEDGGVAAGVAVLDSPILV